MKVICELAKKGECKRTKCQFNSPTDSYPGHKRCHVIGIERIVEMIKVEQDSTPPMKVGMMKFLYYQFLLRLITVLCHI